jgi:FkbM family methyltransferase
MNYMNLNWNGLEDSTKQFISNEIFVSKMYDYWSSVKDGDIVVDIGSSVGPFSYKALSQGAKKVFAIEPSVNLIKTNILNNSEFFINKKESPIIFINKAISNITGENYQLSDAMDIYGDDKRFIPITFSDFIQEYKINKINFLKIDCEGGEYDILKKENLHYLKNNVDFIACEVHERNIINGRDKFKKLLNDFLCHFPKNSYKFMCNIDNVYTDITEYISEESGMNYILTKIEVMLYIKNS